MRHAWITFATAFVAMACELSTRSVLAEDWPMLGRSGTRNNVSTETGAPTRWNIEERNADQTTLASQGIRWSARLGSQTHSSPVVSSGLVWIGTNGARSGMKNSDSNSVLKCFRVTDGKQVYEYISPQLLPRIHDAGWTGLGSSPLIEGDRLWLTTNRSEVLCLDIGPLRRGDGLPRELWKLDLVKTFDTSPYVPIMGPPRPCSIGPSWNGRIFVTTNNGIGDDFKTVPKPDAPSLVCLNKETGEVFWTDNSPGPNILTTQFASPTVVEIRGQVQVIVPQGDGWLRAFDPMTGAKLWEFDVNPKAALYSDSTPRSARNSLLGNAVVYDERVYIASGRDVEQGEGAGRLACIDPTKRGDISSELAVDANDQPLPRRRVQAVDPTAGEKAIPNPNSALLWEFVSCGKAFEDKMHRTMGSVVVAKGLVIVADIAGLVHCLDAKTSKRHWRYDLLATVWGSPLIVDDKIYVSDEDGDIEVFGLSADPKVALRQVNGEHRSRRTISMGDVSYSSPCFANGVLYLATRTQLFAIADDNDLPDRKLTGGFWPQWRGPNRDNISSDTGLLKEWPEAGPPLVWRIHGLGDGVAPVSIGGGRIFSTSLYDTTEHIRALDEKTGQPLWSAVLGPTQPQHRLMRWYTQRSPTVDGECLYAMSLLGDLVCLRTRDGIELWRKSYATDFAGQRGMFGYADCPLVNGETVICTPGGTEASIVALNKFTGAVIWKCAVPDCGRASYSNGVLATIAGTRQFVVYFEKALVGVSADEGKLLWRHDGFEGGSNNQHTPFVRDGFIICINGFITGIKRLEVTRANNGFVVNEVYANTSNHLARFQDDTVFLGEHLYEPGSGVFSCFDGTAGAAVWKKRMGEPTAISYADGHFYFHGNDGRIRLVEAGLTEPVVKGEFVLPDHQNSLGTTRPVVTAGRHYVREDDQLFCFDVRDNVPDQKVEPRTIQLELPRPAPSAANIEASEGARARTLRSVYVPTPQDIVEKMLELAAIKKSDIVYDLGSGDGRIVIAAAAKYGCHAVGYELDKELVESSRARIKEANLAELATIEHKDLFSADLSKADVVMAYLLPAQLKKLRPQLKSMKPGTRFVSHQFEIPGCPADLMVNHESTDDGVIHSLYIWTLPLKQEIEIEAE